MLIPQISIFLLSTVKIKKGGKMKKLASILILCLLFLFACANTNQNPKSMPQSYDGKWEGYTDTPEVRYEIDMEIRDGIMSGHFDGTKIKGYIESDNNLSIGPFKVLGAHVALETNFMSPDRIEGTVIASPAIAKWFVEKAGTDKPEIITSNFQINEKEPWTGKWKVEASTQVSGIWAMKQEGHIVKSTRDSAYEFNGKVQGNQLSGNFGPTYGQYSPFIIEMHSDSMSFKGSLDYFGSLRNTLKGKRIE